MAVCPESVAFIVDGNRRWAEANGVEKLIGYKRGYNVVKNITEVLPDFGVKYVTYFVFSAENWNRPPDEIEYLMSLLRQLLCEEKDFILDMGVKFFVIGDRSRLPLDILISIQKLEEETKKNTRLTLVLAIGYSGRDEIVRATKKIMSDTLTHKINEKDLNEIVFANYLDTSGIPYPDLVIRTSEMRVSNFLIWQMAYSELFFIKKFWPDFNRDDLQNILNDFSQRKRRYGR